VEPSATEIVANSATELRTDCFEISKGLNEGKPKGRKKIVILFCFIV